ncbi:MAG: (2Fe-2S) ferredoxin domain-containing protein [Oscillochloridaceae bacterium umkhey_bin13]
MGKHDRERAVKLEHLIRNRQPCLAVCGGKDCARAGTKHVLAALKAALTEIDGGEQWPVVLTKCQDHCDDGPIVTVVPGPYTYLDLDPTRVREVIVQHIRDGNPVREYLHKRLRKRLLVT